MSHTGELLHDLAIVMIVAGLVTIVFHRLRQPVVLGYILAGVIIGPNTPPFPLIRDQQSIDTLAELGVILLMFGLGLHFSLTQLVRVGAGALIAAGLEIVVMLVAGYGLGRAFGWSTMDSIFLGAILSVSSTTIIIKALEELGLTKERFARLVFGILIVEDVLAIAMIALLSGIVATGSLAVRDVTVTVGKLAIFMAMLLVVGLLLVPALLRYVARFKSNEMMLVTALGLCFGVSLLAQLLGYSVALGAFMIGAVIAESREAGRVSALIEPVRDMFSAVFFVAIGMMIDPKLLWQYALPIVLITVVVVVGKMLTCSAGAFLAGNDRRTSLRVGMAVSQIGEFSFIIAQLGLTLNTTSDFLYPIAVSVSAVTTLLTPYLIVSSDRVVTVFERLAPNTVLGYLDTYHRWASELGGSTSDGSQMRKLMRKWAMQIGLNVALISGVLIGAKSVAIWMERRATMLPPWTGGPRAAAWFLAVLIILPLLIATTRKLRAVAAVLAEMTVKPAPERANAVTARAIVANTIVISVGAAIGVCILALSAALLPPWPVLAVLLVVILIVIALMWRSFIKLYATAQISIQQTLTQEHPPAAQHDSPQLPPLLSNARIETVSIAAGSAAAGKLIRELQLRTATGASAVGIERDGASVVNPGPDEELQPGDRVLLLGDEKQLQAARKLLLTGAT